MHAGEDHRVRHLALARVQPLALGHVHLDAEAELDVVQVQVHDPAARLGRLADVAAEEDGDAVHEHGDADALHRAHRHVHVPHRPALVHVAKAFDAELLPVAVARVVHEAEERVVVGAVARLDGYRRRQLLRESDGRMLHRSELAVLVVEGPGEDLVRARRWAEHKHQHAMDILHHLLLGVQNVWF